MDEPMTKNSIKKVSLWSMVLAGVAIIILVYGFIHLVHFLSENDAEEVHFFIFIATLALAIIAYYEFNKSHIYSKNEFLLFISNRWGSIEIVKARKIIHELFVTEYRVNKLSFPDAQNAIGNKIYVMSQTGGSKGEDFVDLLNLLDFLETLGYFHSRGDLDLDDIFNIFGGNIKFLYPLFKQYIDKRRERLPNDYNNIISLHTNVMAKPN